MLSILDKIYIKDATDGEYTEVESVRDMFDVLTSTIFLPDWADEIYKFNETKAEPYSIEFKLPKTTCPHCNTIQNERAVNVENLLFFKLRGKM
jgi:hypothetical protein